jgi:hypothetical protein
MAFPVTYDPLNPHEAFAFLFVCFAMNTVEGAFGGVVPGSENQLLLGDGEEEQQQQGGEMDGESPYAAVTLVFAPLRCFIQRLMALHSCCLDHGQFLEDLKPQSCHAVFCFAACFICRG